MWNLSVVFCGLLVSYVCCGVPKIRTVTPSSAIQLDHQLDVESNTNVVDLCVNCISKGPQSISPQESLFGAELTNFDAKYCILNQSRIKPLCSEDEVDLGEWHSNDFDASNIANLADSGTWICDDSISSSSVEENSDWIPDPENPLLQDILSRAFEACDSYKAADFYLEGILCENKESLQGSRYDDDDDDASLLNTDCVDSKAKNMIQDFIFKFYDFSELSDASSLDHALLDLYFLKKAFIVVASTLRFALTAGLVDRHYLLQLEYLFFLRLIDRPIQYRWQCTSLWHNLFHVLTSSNALEAANFINVLALYSWDPAFNFRILVFERLLELMDRHQLNQLFCSTEIMHNLARFLNFVNPALLDPKYAKAVTICLCRHFMRAYPKLQLEVATILSNTDESVPDLSESWRGLQDAFGIQFTRSDLQSALSNCAPPLEST